MKVTNKGQYNYDILEDGKRLSSGVVDDPFIVSTVEFHLSRRDALKAIFRPLVKIWQFRVRGEDPAYRVVFQGDYSPAPEGPTESVTRGEADA